MKVVEHILSSTEPRISFEITPPLRGGTIASLIDVVDRLAQYHPPFIDVTSHAAERKNGRNGVTLRRKRPGTLGICAVIKHAYKIDAVPHVLCKGFTREESEDFLIDMHYLGIENVLAIQGDDHGYQKPVLEGRSINTYAKDLVQQITAMNKGKYLEDVCADQTNFCIGVAGYPEKNVIALDKETDIRYLKEKVEAGAQYIVTQMFFDNQNYFNFVGRCRAAGITVPIIPGLKIITKQNQLVNIPNFFHVEIPSELAEEVRAAKPEHVPYVGVEWAARQVKKLLNANIPLIHFYVVQNADPIEKLIEQLK